jgi:hypothetical protein
LHACGMFLLIRVYKHFAYLQENIDSSMVKKMHLGVFCVWPSMPLTTKFLAGLICKMYRIFYNEQFFCTHIYDELNTLGHVIR